MSGRRCVSGLASSSERWYGLQPAVTHAFANTTRYLYNSAGNLVSIVDPNGLSTTFTYGAPAPPGRVSTITDPAGRVTQLGYDMSGRLVSITDPNPGGGGPLAVTGFAYDPANGLTALTDPRSFTTTFTYSAAERVTTVTLPPTVIAPGGSPTATTEQLAAAQVAGLAAAGSGTAGNPAAPAVLAGGLPQATYTDARGNTWTTRLDPTGFGLALQKMDPPASPPYPNYVPGTTTYVRDANGNVIRVPNPLGEVIRTVYDFQNQGNVIKQYLPDFDAVNNPQSFYQYTYNQVSEPTSETDPGGVTTTFVYDANGNLTQKTLPADPGSPIAAVTIAHSAMAGLFALLGGRTDEKGAIGVALSAEVAAGWVVAKYQ